MPSNHISVKNGLRGSGGEHFSYLNREGHYAYIARDGKFEERGDLQTSGSGNLPAWAQHDPAIFWQAADHYERANGRIYKEVVVSLPRALSAEQRVELVNEFVKNLVGERHAYSWAIHSPHASDGGEQPHAHIMFTTRTNDGIERDPAHFFRRWNREHPEKGGAGKDRYFDTKQFVRDVREEWAMTANHFMSRHGIEARIEHRSYKTLGIELEPSVKLGIARYGGERGVMEDVVAENRARAQRNGERLLANPAIGVHALTALQSVFSRRDVEQFVFRNTDSEEQFRQVLARMLNSKELQVLRDNSREGEWFTSRELREIEVSLIERSVKMSNPDQAVARERRTDADVLRNRVRSGRSFNPGQLEAFDLLIGSRSLAVVNGAAGTGKSYVLSAAREALEAEGQRVIGAALQGKTADDMQRDAGISSRTLHSLLASLERGSLHLDRDTVVFVDEAGMVGSRQMEKLLRLADDAQARVRLVGDAYQLHAVDAGDAFRAVSKQAERNGSLRELVDIVRQREPWQREASQALARHDVAAAIHEYADRGHVLVFEDMASAREALVRQVFEDRERAPNESRILLAHTNDQRDALNSRVRELRRLAGDLGADHVVRSREREIPVAIGERIMFLRNDRQLDVRNGTVGTIELLDHLPKGEQDNRPALMLTVRLDDGRRVGVSTAAYQDFDYAYAMTIHKSQGVTVDRAYLLATNSMNAELAYVGMTRHKAALTIATGADQFSDIQAFTRVLSRPAEKAFSAAYDVVPAAQRAVDLGYRHSLLQRRVSFATGPAPRREREPVPSRDRAVVNYVRALEATEKGKALSQAIAETDRLALRKARADLLRTNRQLHTDLDRLVRTDDRAWEALVELAGTMRARDLVVQARERLVGSERTDKAGRATRGYPQVSERRPDTGVAGEKPRSERKGRGYGIE
jgi:Ti-type conjugative transfer relaxase TraA